MCSVYAGVGTCSLCLCFACVWRMWHVRLVNCCVLCAAYEVSGVCGGRQVSGGPCVACDVWCVCGMVSAGCLWHVLCAVCQCGMVCGLRYSDLFLKRLLDYEYGLVPELRARQLSSRHAVRSLRLSLPAQHPPISPHPWEKGHPLEPSSGPPAASLPHPRSLLSTHSWDIQVISCLLSRTTVPSAWSGSPRVTHTHLVHPESL